MDAARSMSLDLARLAAAISFLETGDNDAHIGPNGGRGRYNMQRQLWEQITFLPFEHVHNATTAQRVMAAHLRWLKQKLSTVQRENRSRLEIMALGWVAGPQAVRYRFATPEQQESAGLIATRYHFTT